MRIDLGVADRVMEVYEEGYEQGHEDGFEDAIEQEANMNILEDAGWRLVKLIVERINNGPSEDNLLEEAIEDTVEEFLEEMNEEGAEGDEYTENADWGLVSDGV